MPGDPAAVLAAIAAGATHAVVDLIRSGADAQRLLHAGVPAIGWCAYHGDTTAVRLLIEHGVPASTLGPNLDLHGAVFHGHERLTAWCLNAGADPSHRLESTGETPLHAALTKANRPVTGRIVRLLLDHGADVHAVTTAGAPLDSFMRDVRARGETALHRAAAFADLATIDALLAAGAKPDAPDADGQTPLAWSSWHLRPDAILRRLCYGPHRIHPDRDGSYDHGLGWSHGERHG